MITIYSCLVSALFWGIPQPSSGSHCRKSGNGARMNLLMLGMEYNDALELINKNDTLGTYERMKNAGYLRKRLIV